MKLLKKLFHRHKWITLQTVYRYRDYQTGRKYIAKRCQCRDCGKIEYIHLAEKK